jgi:hypothetical protein
MHFEDIKCLKNSEFCHILTFVLFLIFRLKRISKCREYAAVKKFAVGYEIAQMLEAVKTTTNNTVFLSTGFQKIHTGTVRRILKFWPQ